MKNTPLLNAQDDSNSISKTVILLLFLVLNFIVLTTHDDVPVYSIFDGDKEVVKTESILPNSSAKIIHSNLLENLLFKSN